jgi:hypothetical protein
MRSRTAPYVIPLAGAVLMLVGAILLATRPTLTVARGRSFYIGFADSGPDYTVPIALGLTAVGFAAVTVWAIVGLVRERTRGRSPRS